MHIVHIATGFIGGPVVIVQQLMEMQRAAGHRVTLVYGRTHNGFEAEAAKLPQDFELIGWDAGREISPGADKAAYHTLVAHLRQLKPDVVHMHNSKAGALGRLACARLGIRNIYSPHGPAYLRRDIGLLKRAVLFAIEWGLGLFGDQLVASSGGEMRAIRLMPGRKHLITNGVDIREITAKAAGAPVKPHQGRFRIVLSSRIWAQKNPQQVASVAAKSPADWEWCWIGDGPERAELDATGRVDILGWQKAPDVLATIKTADAYMQASHSEGMSFSLLEAMTLGRPCVVSDVPGNQDLVRPGISGFVCESDEDYLKALTQMADDVALRRKLGEGAANMIADSFSLTRIAADWSRLYRGLTKQPSTFRDFIA